MQARVCTTYTRANKSLMAHTPYCFMLFLASLVSYIDRYVQPNDKYVVCYMINIVELNILYIKLYNIYIYILSCIINFLVGLIDVLRPLLCTW